MLLSQDGKQQQVADSLVEGKDLEERMLTRNDTYGNRDDNYSERNGLSTIQYSELDRQPAFTQPNFHQSKKTCGESIFFCCITSKDLNVREDKFYQKFKKTMVEPYDSTKEEHERNLARLFYSATGLAAGSPIPSEDNTQNVSMMNE